MRTSAAAPALLLFLSACGAGTDEGAAEPVRRTPGAPGRAVPPPAACDQRRPGATAIRAIVRIDRYLGLRDGRSGTHEVAEGSITAIPWVFAADVIDSRRVQLALNVASDRDPRGLPHEVPLERGESVELQGEYVSARADGSAAHGQAVIHFTHPPCGYVVIRGRKYP